MEKKKNKIIKDIRYYETNIENKKGNPLPVRMGKNIYQLKGEIVSISKRIAKKLNELNFISGDFDHININFSTFLDENHIKLSIRDVRNSFQEIDYGLTPQEVNFQVFEIQQELITNKTFYLLEYLYKNDIKNLKIIEQTKELVKQYGSYLEIKSFTKETKTYKIIISYQIRPNRSDFSRAFIEFIDFKNNIRKKKHFLDMEFHEDIYPLVGQVSLKGNIILITPKKSSKANVYTERYKTPISINIEKIPLVGA